MRRACMETVRIGLPLGHTSRTHETTGPLRVAIAVLARVSFCAAVRRVALCCTSLAAFRFRRRAVCTLTVAAEA